MKKYASFIFDSYEFNRNTGRVSLHYSLDDDLAFTETLTLPLDGMKLAEADEDELDAVLFALHLIGGVSYYKTCLPKRMQIHSGELTSTQAQFWNSVYEHGLGEFFYRNNLDFRNLISFPADAKQPKRFGNVVKKKIKREAAGRVLVPIGGGKDSIVTMGLLKKGIDQLTLFRVGGHPIIDDIAHIAGLPLLTIKRQLSPVLFDLNKEGALNGHVPITAYLSFVTVLVAILYGYDAVAMSNEGSASEGNVMHFGREINHQWSKGLVFERMMRDYTAKNISPSVEYFSLLRPMSELRVTQLFSQYPLYFDHFTSCNANWKILQDRITSDGAAMHPSEASGAWCNHCPKCAFVFCMMTAFLPLKQVVKIFGKDLHADESLLPLYRELLGLAAHKPFECVGTPDETKAAFLLAMRRGDAKKSAAMRMFEKEVLPTIDDQDMLIDACLKIGDDHLISGRFAGLLPR